MDRKGLVAFIALSLLAPLGPALAGPGASGDLSAPPAERFLSLKGTTAVGPAPESRPAGKHRHEMGEVSEGDRAYIGIEEKLGENIPLDIPFFDEEGRRVSLGELVDKPTVLSLIYYSCPDVCPLLLSGVAEVVGRMPGEPGEDYNLLTVSFDERDTPADARQKKANYLRAGDKPVAEEVWRFLTGERESIKRLTDAVGFRFKRRGKIFLHPVSLVVLSPRGRVVRYLYGNTFLPFDLKMALTEASEGRFSPTINRVLLYCFSYDPKGRKYVFNILKVMGTSMLLVVAAMFVLLTVKGRGRARKEG